jgi:hypothetical protein
VLSVSSELIVNSNSAVSFHHTMTIERRLEDDETERQMKYKTHDMELCILGCFSARFI